MKKLIVLFCLILLTGCAVKSALVHQEGYPRNYPTY